MNPVQIILMAIDAIRSLSKHQKTDDLLQTLSLLIQGGLDTWSELQAFALQVKAMADAGTDPTPEQWQSLKDREAVANAALQANAQALGGG